MIGVDLSVSMLRKLSEKSGGHAPFPLVLADATALPFSDGSFGAAVARHVLHLIPDWPAAVANLARVVRSGGLLLLNIGVDGGPWQEISDHLESLVGPRAQRVGLQPKDVAELDLAVADAGGRLRELPYVWQMSDLTINRYLQEVDDRVHSWTWTVDESVLTHAIAATRAWASDRFGDLDEVIEERFPIAWRAYDLT
jgi:SAM-dependent methyltransferase